MNKFFYFSNVLVVIALTICILSSTSAEQKFPFEIEFTGELIEGFFFGEITTTTGDNLTEVIVTNSDGAVVFPADVQFSFPIVKLMYAKILGQKEAGEKNVNRSLEELIRVLTPRTTQQMMVYPYVEENLVFEVSQFANLQPVRLKEIIAAQEPNFSEQQKKLGEKVKLFVIISGATVRKYQVEVSDSGDELVSISLKIEHSLFGEKIKQGEATNILPPK